MTIVALPEGVEELVSRLAKDVESAVHAMYRGEVGAGTAHGRTEHLVHSANERLAELLRGAEPASGAPKRFSVAVAASAIEAHGDVRWTGAEAAAVTRCVMAWVPMGPPTSAPPDSRCVAPGKDLIPLWGERELARHALRRVPVQE